MYLLKQTKCIIVFSIALILLLYLPQKQHAADLPAGFAEILIAQNLDPVSMAIAPDGRVFIAEKNGRILIARNNTLLPDPFVVLEVDNFNERGLSGIAFDPNFDQNNYIYVFYTVNGRNFNRVSRLTANGDFAIPGSETVLLETDPLSGTIHNGGAMKFGPDGMLYIATGDGSNPNNSQNLNSLHGKFLRIRADGSIPDDNPFASQLSGPFRSIWAIGFRNPFTFDIQPGTGKIFSNDVGQENWEEINEVVKGANYGWPMIEGRRTNQTAPANYRDPVYAYSHSDGCAIVGSAFYSPELQAFPPAYANMFFFSDYCRGYIRMIDATTYQSMGTFATGIDRVVGLTTAPDGSMYYLERGGLGGGSQQDNTSSNNGRLWKVIFTGSGAPFISRQPQAQRIAEGETARFEVLASGEQPLQYQWSRNGSAIAQATQAILEVPSVTTAMDGDTFFCTITNSAGSITSHTVALSVVAGSRPVPIIALPAIDALYRAGDVLSFAGSATDAEDGPIPTAQLSWWIDFHHDDHTHPALAATHGLAQGDFTIPRVGEVSDNVFYRIYLRATDSDGLAAIAFRDVHPVKSEIRINAEPAHLQVMIDGRVVEAPFSTASVVGVSRAVIVPVVQVRNDTTWVFSHWKNRPETEALIQFNTPEDVVEFVAVFNYVLPGNGDGLVGFYFNNQALNFNSGYQFWRKDPVIDFDWGNGSPDAAKLGIDFFLIRWEGEVEAQFTGTYTFHTVSDDGVRLFLNNTPVIDRWVDQGPTEWSGTYAMEAGKRYPIKLEYYERGGGAMVQLLWGFNNFFKEVIPKAQLYTESVIASAPNAPELRITLYPNPAKDFINIEGWVPMGESTHITIHQMNGAEMGHWLVPAGNGAPMTLNVAYLQRGVYLLLLRSGEDIKIVKLLKE